MAGTTPKHRQSRLGQPSLFRALAIVAVIAVVAIGIYMLAFPGEEPGAEETDVAESGAVQSANESVDGQGAEPEGIGGSANPGVFEDSASPLAEGSSPNATSASQGDEMMDLPADPPGGGRVDPGPDDAVAGEIADEEQVPERVRESDVRTALPQDEGSGGGGDGASSGDASSAADGAPASDAGSSGGGQASGSPDATAED